MTAFTWLDFILVGSFAQGVFLGFLLWLSPKWEHPSHKMLSILLFASSATVFLFLNTRIRFLNIIQVDILLDTLAFAYAPLLYLYVKNFIDPSGNTRFKSLYFVPAGLHFLYFVQKLQYSSQEFVNLCFSGAFYTEWAILLSFLTIYVWAYWYLSVRLLLNFKKKAQFVATFRPNFKFLSIFLGAVALCYIVSILFALDFFLSIKLFAFTGIELGWVVIPFLVYIIAYYALQNPEAFEVRYIIEKKETPRLKEDELQNHKAALEKLMQIEKLYLDPELSLGTVAEKLNLTMTTLSWLINKNYECNFYDFVNRYRISEFLEKLEKKEHKKKTLSSLAFESGFNSRTTFNKFFKKTTQNTPSEYLEKLNA